MSHRILLPLAVLLATAGSAGAQAPDADMSYAEACDLGELVSCGLLGLIYETGAAGDRNLVRAGELYGRACDRDVAAACLRLALLAEEPPGDPTADPFVRFGRVADAEAGTPVANALVELPDLGLRRIADQQGRVDLGRLPRGSHRITVRRAGYSEIRGELPVPWESEFLILMFAEAVEESPAFGSVFGQVIDATTGAPLANVEVTVLAPNPIVTISNQDGRFAVGRLSPGPAEVRLNHIGFEERRQAVTIERGRTVEVYAALATRPIELEPIEVTVGSSYLDRSGFYRRARTGAGYALTRRNLDAVDMILLSEVFSRIPGVFAERTRTGTHLFSRREMGRDRAGACRLRPYLDGSPMIDWDIDTVSPDDVEGIEVHQGLAAPIEYRNLIDPDGTTPCGVVLIWTTRGGRG